MGCLKSFNMSMSTMDNRVWLSVWCPTGLLGPSRYLLHQLSLGNSPSADFDLGIASLNKRHRCFGQWTFVIMLCRPLCPVRLGRVRRVARPWKLVRDWRMQLCEASPSSVPYTPSILGNVGGKEGRKENGEVISPCSENLTHLYFSELVWKMISVL